MRRLGAGNHSEVWLGSDGSETAAIKVFHTTAARERIDVEIESLGRASNRHLLRLDDLAMGPDGVPCLILQRLTQWSVGRILATSRPSEGEAVTILAPLCLAIAELHRVGVAHGRVRGSSVLFDDAGAPVLTSFGDAELLGPMPTDPSRFSLSPARLAQEPAVAADLAGLSALCLSTLEPHSSVAQWLSASCDRDPSSFSDELAERLFRSAHAAPVRFATSLTAPETTQIPSRVAAPSGSGNHELANAPHSEPVAAEAPRRAAASVTGVASLLHVPDDMVNTWVEWLGRTLEREPVSSVISRITVALKPVRRPVWVFAGLVAVGVVAAVAILPVGDRSDTVQAETPSSSPTPVSISSTALAEITGDDPVAAASALLEARADCFSTQSVLCLDSVDQRGSAAMDADSVQIRLLSDGGADDGSFLAVPYPNDGASPSGKIVLVERLGDSVLLSTSFHDSDAPAARYSLLLIKKEEGWRIRDIMPLMDSTN